MRAPLGATAVAASSEAIRGERGGVESGQVFFGRKASWRNERGPGCDDQGTVGSSERRGESLNGVPIRFADFFEFREVMDETGVNHAIRGGGSTPEAVRILRITPMDPGTSGCKGLGGSV